MKVGLLQARPETRRLPGFRPGWTVAHPGISFRPIYVSYIYREMAHRRKEVGPTTLCGLTQNNPRQTRHHAQPSSPARRPAAGCPIHASPCVAALPGRRPPNRLGGSSAPASRSRPRASCATTPGGDPATQVPCPSRLAPLQAGGNRPPPSLHCGTRLGLI